MPMASLTSLVVISVADRKLWLDTRGEPVITTTPNGVENANRWGWTEAIAVAAPSVEVIANELENHAHAYSYQTGRGSTYLGCRCRAKPEKRSPAPDDAWLNLHRAQVIADLLRDQP